MMEIIAIDSFTPWKPIFLALETFLSWYTGKSEQTQGNAFKIISF